MAFLCPGGCDQTHPATEGNLVYLTGRPYGDASPAVVLCGPCTAQLVLARSGPVRLP